MKRLRLRPALVPVICLLLLGTIFYSGYQIWQILSYDRNIVPDIPVSNDNSSSEKTIPTMSVKEVVIRPYDSSKVIAEIPFYRQDGTKEEQEAALIYYENIYMQNTGVMYTSDEVFNVMSVLDGTVKSIDEDEIMGKIVTIENNKNITTIYQSIDNVNVKVGDKLKQGDVIGTSGKNKILSSDRYALHFEVFRKGEIINPEEFYLLSLEDINE